jgi:2-polyprenyl-6-methoxyphenol hydroxylase-like FAD-dependent oxidoreductase
MRIAIAGGGIGGLSLALALHDAGIDDLTVFESASALRELGVGINVMPHAVRELAELGLLDDLTATGICTAEFVLFNKHGQRIWGEPRGTAAGYHWPQVSIHRGELLGILHRAVLARLGPDRMRTGHHLTEFGQAAGQVWAEFGDRASGATIERIEADLLVGCDGIHSAVRRRFYPEEGPPRWDGVTMWRGVTESMPFLSGRTMMMAGYLERRAVIYPISRRHEWEGRALINWVMEYKNAPGQTMPPQDWVYTARREDVLAPFVTFEFPFMNVPGLIRGAENVFQYPMVDRDPLPTWDFGRVTLLGDAAHPMYPTGGNGASQAILDARVLARELATQPSIEAAVAAYDAIRRPAMAAVVLSNRAGGPERAMAIVEERAPGGFTHIDDVIGQEELEQIASSYKQIAGFDRDTLNNRPSFSVRRSAGQE